MLPRETVSPFPTENALNVQLVEPPQPPLRSEPKLIIGAQNVWSKTSEPGDQNTRRRAEPPLPIPGTVRDTLMYSLLLWGERPSFRIHQKIRHCRLTPVCVISKHHIFQAASFGSKIYLQLNDHETERSSLSVHLSAPGWFPHPTVDGRFPF